MFDGKFIKHEPPLARRSGAAGEVFGIVAILAILTQRLPRLRRVLSDQGQAVVLGKKPAASTDLQNAEVASILRELTALRAQLVAGAGADASSRGVRIMVTMPSETATNYSLLRDLLQHGMNCMRINCVRDDAAAWLQMVKRLQQAERELGRSC